jgi:uncharacterized caspase-like protein
MLTPINHRATAIVCSLGQLLRRVIITVVVVAAGLVTASAADWQDSSQKGATEKPEAGHLDEARARELASGQERSARVLATEERWQSSGVLVRGGQNYRIEASGEWKAGTLCNPSGPSGKDVYTLLCFPSPIDAPVVLGFSFGTLIAKIGRDGTPFMVGDKLDFEATRDGLLYLRINEGPGWAWDNSGFVTAVISLVQDTAPSPPTRQPDAGTPVEKAFTAPQTAAAVASRAQHWAVVIGVSEYADSKIPSLRFAAADAKAVYDWLVDPSGGRYAPARVRLLLNREATATNIRDALFNWLRQAIAEDAVLIYFAGHGSPDSPDSAQNLFLLPHDTRYDNVAATGFPMWDIETALKRFIPARRVVVIADACHSGGVGVSYDIARRAASGAPANPISSGLQSLSKVGDGIAVISASDERQLSAEGVQFGGGHGVFTYFLIKGLKGAADYNRDGKVSLGELIPYLSENVRRETQSAQSPTVAGKFDPAIAIARQPAP